MQRTDEIFPAQVRNAPYASLPGSLNFPAITLERRERNSNAPRSLPQCPEFWSQAIKVPVMVATSFSLPPSTAKACASHTVAAAFDDAGAKQEMIAGPAQSGWS